MRFHRLILTTVAGLLLLATFATPAQSQRAPLVLGPPDSGKVQRLTLNDGSQLIGKIVSVSATSVQFESSLGTRTIDIASIVSVREERPGTMRDGKYYFPNPNATRLFFGPTGRMLERGEGYFSDFWIFFPGIAVGLADKVTFGGGMTIFPGADPTEQLWFITPKIGIIQRPKFNFAVGALAAGVPSDDEHNTAGILYGVGTWGAADNSFTAGVGYGFVNGDVADRPAILLGGETRLSPRISLVTENYVLPGGNNFIVSAGPRFFGHGISVDFSLTKIIVEDDASPFFPMVGFLWKW